MTSDLVIEAYGLCKHYGAVEAVKSLTFEVSRHRITGFLGRNGADKAPLSRCCSAWFDPRPATLAF